MPRHVIGRADELRRGDRKVVQVAGRSVGVFHVDGGYFALRNRCPHQGGPLCMGRLSGYLIGDVPGEYRYTRPGEILRCPWHGWEFDIRTGHSWFDPARTRVRAYPVSVVAGAELVQDSPAQEALAEDPPAPGLQRGPYTAEMYPISIDGEYLVIDIPN